MVEKVIAVIDLKSFYASCECAARNLDPLSTPLVVCDPTRGEGTIVMSTSPYLKSKYGVPNVCRRKDLPLIEGMIYAQPRMAYYLEMSSRVISIFLEHVGEEDLHVYSVDESFLSLGPYLKLNKATPEEIVAQIQKEIKKRLGLIATAGIGPNVFLAKVALDNEGKKKPPFIAHWTMADIPTKLWSLSPITEIWGISGGIEKRLAKIGIRSVKELAEADEERLLSEFGVIGHQLKRLANGIDESDIREKGAPKERSLSLGQVLKRDYSAKEASLILREMVDDLCLRLRMQGKMTAIVSCYVGYSSEENGGFSHQARLDCPSDDNDALYKTIIGIFHRYAEELPIRRLGICFAKLGEYSCQQLSLFESPEVSKEKHSLHQTIDKIQNTYGKNSCLRASSLSKASTAHERHELIGGHKA